MTTGTRVTVNGQAGTVTQIITVGFRRKLQTLINIKFDDGRGGTFEKAQVIPS